MDKKKDDVPGSPPGSKRTKKPREIADELGINVETVYDYIRDGIFTNSEYFVIQRPERVRYVFFADAVETFLARNRQPFLTDEKPKRMYNKRTVKGKHAKGKKSA